MVTNKVSLCKGIHGGHVDFDQWSMNKRKLSSASGSLFAGQLHRSKVKRFRAGLVFKAHGLVYHLTLGLRVMKKKKQGACSDTSSSAGVRTTPTDDNTFSRTLSQPQWRCIHGGYKGLVHIKASESARAGSHSPAACRQHGRVRTKRLCW